MRENILFLTLRTFSSTGGIEKVCRVFGKVLYEYAAENERTFQICSMHDNAPDADDNRYFPSELFLGFNGSKISFMTYALSRGSKSRIIVLSHINLLSAAWLIKKASPTVRIFLIAHGIEVWGRIKGLRRKMLAAVDCFIPVSHYTQTRMIADCGLPNEKFRIINNCLDPFLPLPRNVSVNENLLKRYGLNTNDRILLTLSRLSAKERYKGYEKVMAAMKKINSPNIKYLIAGPYDKSEEHYIRNRINEMALEDRVILAGFIPENEVADHFIMSDVYVMPSIKEGFGIVFIEAMYYGLPVVAGNQDGSVDALRNGELGILVNPDSIDEIANAIGMALHQKGTFTRSQRNLLDFFNYEHYKLQIDSLLSSVFVSQAPKRYQSDY